jgi:phosphoribosylaminoimidazolecarboxamide formyltransferase/IMP cyclohydrolase
MKALLSVSNKEGIVAFAQGLNELEYELMSTPGTAGLLSEHGVQVTNIGNSESWPAYAFIEKKQLVTYTRSIHAALMIDIQHRATVVEQEGLWIDLLCLNPLPLEESLPRPLDTRALSTLDTIDLGGTALLKSAIKGKRIIVCDPADYPHVLRWLKQGKPDEARTIARMGQKALILIQERHEAISTYLQTIAPNSDVNIFPDD